MKMKFHKIKTLTISITTGAAILWLVATLKCKLRYVSSLSYPVNAYYNIIMNICMRPNYYPTLVVVVSQDSHWEAHLFV